jgi:hypothetical protein
LLAVLEPLLKALLKVIYARWEVPWCEALCEKASLDEALIEHALLRPLLMHLVAQILLPNGKIAVVFAVIIRHRGRSRCCPSDEIKAFDFG